MMPSSSSSERTSANPAAYDELYGVGLLDDLHNYFPALLYEPAEFEDISDVMNYVAARASQQFELYSFGREAYLEGVRQRRLAWMARGRRLPPVAPNQIYSTPSDEINPHESSAASSSSQEPTTPPPSNRHSTVIQTTGRQNGQFLSQSLLTALMAPNLQTIYPPVERRLMTLTNLANLIQILDATPSALGNAIPPGFLDPIRVPPSEDQIEIATAVENTQGQDPGTCSICQDTFEPEQEVRKIRHCGHAFHLECIDTWFEQSSTCPTCRYDIRDFETNQPSANDAPSELDGVE